MEALFKIPVQDFDHDFFKRLQEVLKRFGSGEITISVRDKTERSDAVETDEQYESRLLHSIKELDEGKGIHFTKESLENYVRGLVKE